MEKALVHRPRLLVELVLVLLVGTTSALARPMPGELGPWCATLGAHLGADGRDVIAQKPDGGRTRLVRAAGPIQAIAVSPSSDLVAVITSGSENAVSVYRLDGRRLRFAGGGVEAKRQPVRVSWGDVDADGRIEALVLVTGRARFDRRLALRPFVYGWDGSRLYPKWLGSRLSRPFDDATLGDVDKDGRSELVAVEHTRDRELELAAYRWRGFGFERVATSGSHIALSNLKIGSDGTIEANADGLATRFVIEGDRIIPNGNAIGETNQPPPPILDARTTSQ